MLFRLERNPNFNRKDDEGWELGYKWLEVLAIEPGLAHPDDTSDLTYESASNFYICRSEDGIVRIPSDEIWTAIEDNDELQISSE